MNIIVNNRKFHVWFTHKNYQVTGSKHKLKRNRPKTYCHCEELLPNSERIYIGYGFSQCDIDDAPDARIGRILSFLKMIYDNFSGEEYIKNFYLGYQNDSIRKNPYFTIKLHDDWFEWDWF